MAKVAELNQPIGSDLRPTMMLLDIPSGDWSEEQLKRISREVQTPSSDSPRQQPPILPEAGDFQGLPLLKYITSQIKYQNLSKLFIPVAILHGPDARSHPPALSGGGSSTLGSFSTSESAPSSGQPANLDLQSTIDPRRLLGCMEAGAVDVLTGPLSKERVYNLVVHAYRVHKEVSREQQAYLAVKRGRKRSWVGVNEGKPYAYLREAMVSGLMDGICKPQEVYETFDNTQIFLSPERRDLVAKAVGTWEFSAHDFSDDELLHAALLMLQHALQMPELEKWRLTTENLITFLHACRAAYNSFVLYHNFRHVVDVLQAVFYFLLQIGTLPPYLQHQSYTRSFTRQSPVALLLKPFEALTLLISAIGHDVGHPGVNNAFLIALNAPLAQLYNDRSVLESFHCAAYSQILKRYWPAAFQADMRTLLIKTILATDMGLHFDYMRDLGYLQEKLHHNNNSTDGWNAKSLTEYATLTCGILIKCADICNVARNYGVAAQWATKLTDEFASQGSMEKDLGMPSALFGGPPVRDSIIKMGESQIGFMNIFALPLFQAVTDVLPAMTFAVREMQCNMKIWNGKIEDEKLKQHPQKVISKGSFDGALSPKSSSVADLGHTSEHNIPSKIPLAGRSPRSSSRISLSSESIDASRQSSLGNPTQSVDHPSRVENQSHQSSLGSTTQAFQSSDISSRRSSGAFPTGMPPNLQPQHSSGANISQPQHELRQSSENQESQPRTNHSLMAVVVTSPNGGGKSTSSEGSPTKHSAPHYSPSPFSLSSSRDRFGSSNGESTSMLHAQNPSGTSFSSTNGSRSGDGDKPRSTAPVVPDMEQRGEEKSKIRTTIISDGMGSLPRRAGNRFRLDFWKRRNRAQEASP
ncbi:MAG: 3',5'-cyclic-nucleotide phosphodiesterase [Candelina submexicana]|nr:MAG: 3',5'-cyclic-nucleotide phosphodiesterase [Candelina submexicana]